MILDPLQDGNLIDGNIRPIMQIYPLVYSDHELKKQLPIFY